MRLGKREREALKMAEAIKRANKARDQRVIPTEGRYASMWDRMKPHGKRPVSWEYHGRNATRIARNKRVLRPAAEG